MQIVILSTDTIHHRYFLQQFLIRKPDYVNVSSCIFETKKYPWKKNAVKYFKKNFPNIYKGLIYNPYIQLSYLGKKINKFEEKEFFPSKQWKIPENLSIHYYDNINSQDCTESIRKQKPDLILVYGTSLLKEHIYKIPPIGTINAHGGLLPGYRGLDTNLWAAYLGRPEDMAVTLHLVDSKLDTGPVIAQKKLGKVPGLSILNLRLETTKICTDLFVEAIKSIYNDKLQPLKQTGESKYFYPMPFIIKLYTNKLIKKYSKDRTCEKF